MNRKKTLGIIAVMFLLVTMLAGCGGTAGASEQEQAQAIVEKAQASQEAADTKDDSKKVEALKEKNEIPEDGIITADQFASVQGKNQKIEFDGESEGITYSWIFDASKIQNPIDQNLLITTTDEKVDDVKKMANNAAVGLGLEFQNEADQIAIPEISITLDEKWNADALVLCGIQDEKAAKICDVKIDNSGDTSILTFSPAYTSGTYYIVGGATETEAKETKEPTSAADTKQDTNTTAADSETTENTQSAQEEDTSSNVCTVSITCATILNNMDKLTAGKEEFVPADGMILAPSEIEFTPGESAHDILTRVCQEAGIQMESSFTPAYNSAYIEGINQLYEFDCGELSGWMYGVNGWFPNYGSSLYEVEPGDTITFSFTCDLGRDIGGDGSTGNGNGGRS